MMELDSTNAAPDRVATSEHFDGFGAQPGLSVQDFGPLETGYDDDGKLIFMQTRALPSLRLARPGQLEQTVSDGGGHAGACVESVNARARLAALFGIRLRAPANAAR